jgi:hypothetical protein
MFSCCISDLKEDKSYMLEDLLSATRRSNHQVETQ